MMDAPGKILCEKWVIVPVWVNSMAVARIDYKMPFNVKQCTGVAYTIPDVQGAFVPNNCMGELCLLFNNRKSHPLTFQTEYRTYNIRLDIIILKLEEPVAGGSRLSGYYRNFIDVPQVLKIYLQCIAETF